MEKISKKLTTTIINVGEIIANDDGTHSIKPLEPIRIEATRIESPNAIKYVNANMESGHNYCVLSVEYEENNYSISVADFIAHATKK